MIVGQGGKNWFLQNRTRANILVAITTLRKICNHPDLYLGEFDENKHIVSSLFMCLTSVVHIKFAA